MSVSFTCEMVFITELSMNIEYMTKCNNDKCNSMVFLKIWNTSQLFYRIECKHTFTIIINKFVIKWKI